MPVIKRVLCPRKLRQVPSQFSWIDHRLVRHRHICRCSHPALALYLLLVTVCDGQGLSYYSDSTLSRLLRLEGPALARARQELISAQLIAYQSPLYQVLALEDPGPQCPSPPASPARPALAAQDRPPSDQPTSIAQILRQLMEPKA